MLNIDLSLVSKQARDPHFEAAIEALYNPVFAKQFATLFDDLETDVKTMGTEAIAESQAVIDQCTVEQDFEKIKEMCTPDELAFLTDNLIEG